jgi:hypothetical protein
VDGSSSSTPSSASATKEPMAKRLQNLQGLLDDGHISQAVFKKRQKEILAEI